MAQGRVVLSIAALSCTGACAATGSTPGGDGGATPSHVNASGGSSTDGAAFVGSNEGGAATEVDGGIASTDGGSNPEGGSPESGTTNMPPLGLHAVKGTGGRAGQIVDANGNVVVLHGADESGTENFCTTWVPPIVVSPADGPSPLTQDSLTAMKSWGLNAVRIPLNEDCWLGINGVDSSVGGANYQAPILDAVNLITQTNSMYAILDLHWSAPGTTLPTAQGTMPDVDHSIDFWQQVASAYKNNGSVIFDLFNEPLMPSGTQEEQYDCWESGSTTGDGGACPMVNFAVAGMQQLLSTVRAAGASNLVMLGGTGYASTLGLWPQYVPIDAMSPPNIAASWHVYDDQGGCTDVGSTTATTLCDTSAGLGAQAVMDAGYPIVVGETGYYSCAGDVGQSWWPLFLSWADAQGLGYLAWSWSDSNNPMLLSNTTSFAPSSEGTVYQSYLTCIATKTVTPATSCTFVPSTGCE